MYHGIMNQQFQSQPRACSMYHVILMQKLIYFINKSSSRLCISCQCSENRKLFPSESHSSSILWKVHYDLWGPSPVSSFQRFIFNIIFVDDYSRFCWLYPMRHKSNFFGIFIAIQKYVQTQFDKGNKNFSRWWRR